MEPIVYSAAETAKVLKIAPKVVYEMLEKGEIPAYKIGEKNWKIPKKLLLEYINSRALEEARDRQKLTRITSQRTI